MERRIDEKDRVEEKDRQREKRNAQEHVANAPRVPEPLGDAAVSVLLRCFDGHLEDGLGQEVQEAAAEQTQSDASGEVSLQEIDARPHEVDNDAQVRELHRKPHVRSARQQLKSAAEPFGDVQQRRIQIGHERSRLGSLDPEFA